MDTKAPSQTERELAQLIMEAFEAKMLPCWCDRGQPHTELGCNMCVIIGMAQAIHENVLRTTQQGGGTPGEGHR